MRYRRWEQRLRSELQKMTKLRRKRWGNTARSRYVFTHLFFFCLLAVCIVSALSGDLRVAQSVRPHVELFGGNQVIGWVCGRVW